jgi:hypothetical protein
MALATAADVVKALRRDLTSEEDEFVDSQLDEASDLVIGYLRCATLPTPTPDAVVRVVAAMVAAVFDRPSTLPNADSVNAGPYGWKFTEGSTSNGPWLTAALKMRLAPYRCGGMVSMPLVSERYES